MADGSARVTLEWGDGEHVFRLGKKQLQELQDKTGVGPEELYVRVRLGKWLVPDLRETIRLGIIGGGMDEVEASKLMRNYYDDTPLLKHKPTAQAILLAALVGPPDDPPGGKAQRRGETETTPVAGESPSQEKSESPAQSA